MDKAQAASVSGKRVARVPVKAIAEIKETRTELGAIVEAADRPLRIAWGR